MENDKIISNSKYLFTHGYCAYYAINMMRANENMKTLISLNVTDEDGDEVSVHYFASDGEKVHDIYGSANITVDAMIEHIKDNFPEILNQYCDEEIEEAYIRKTERELISEENINDISNMKVKDLDGVSGFNMTAKELFEAY